ncbi:hypothetical protein RBA41_01965 [Massilia sp. CCM 9210]|uniref:hypothetical protein n=1 Tax=Massilia scottii TaxID=3057166 RepID=UPI002796B5B2|nr:hypothetical protein [Massilia sp. CCM 9210]MDQ1812059.1 hypothetical protein [Massilia sp. CCM 9210]
MTIDRQLVIFVAAHIRDYLSRRPLASDTAEGIHQWWICWLTTPEAISVTMAALELLETDGLLERRKSGTRILWRRSQPPFGRGHTFDGSFRRC